VRVVRMKGKELGIFQFDWDQSWAAMFLNADRTIYGRYGTRTGTSAGTEERATVAGLCASMEGVLDVHAAYPSNKASLKDKTGPGFSGRDVEDLPYFRGRVSDTPRSCIHCHQVWEGVRDEWRAAKKQLTDEQLFIWPVPDRVGLYFEPDERATVRTVTKGSAADVAGLRECDRILAMEGQPILSPADVQWVLHRAKAPGAVSVDVQRADGSKATLSLALAKDWRRGTDLSWRHSSFILRMRFRCDDLADAERATLGIAADALALKVRGADPKGEAARQGLKAGDVIVQVDDRKGRMTETDFLAYLNQECKRGEKVVIQVLEGKKRRRHELKAP
jgi:serine protease Do